MPLALALPLMAGAGVVGAWASSALLRRWDYRLEDEQHLPVPRHTWLQLALPAVLVLLALVHHHDPAALAVLVLATVVAGVLAVIDLDVHRLPDRIQIPGYPVLAGVLLVASLLSSHRSLGDWGRALLAGLIALAVYAALAAIGGEGLGLGDVKLAGLVGLLTGWFSWTALTVALLAGPIIGGLIALVLVVSRRATGKDFIPFGPPIMLGAVVGLVLA